MMQTLQEQIDRAKDRLRKLESQLQARQMRQRAKVAQRTRAQDTRRRILVGAIVLKLTAQGVLAQQTLEDWLDRNLTRDDDRRLFDMALLTPASDSTGADVRPPVSAEVLG